MTTTRSTPPIDRKLIDKYSGRGPRYTSYPTAPEWTEAVDQDIYRKHIALNNQVNTDTPLSLYIHVPFCEERCSFCACNVIITPHKSVSDHYVDLLNREIDMVSQDITPGRKAIQFHLGGGTPTHLTPASFDRMLSHVDERFEFTADAERSIEVDSRVTTEEHLDILRRHGFNRISMGVQDASPQTQEAINRVQSVEHTQAFIDLCRSKGFQSVNIDLVYGLPYQTRVTFARTVDAVFDLNPDRIALYNYAFLPQKLAHQRRIDENSLPDAEERFAIFKTAVEQFTEMGYAFIGMDHFAKPDDELTLAQQAGTLQRNFMGFTTRAGADLYAFGTSSISSLPTIYAQNTKRLRSYESAIQNDQLPIERGIELTRDDQIRRWVIMELMCNLQVFADHFEQTWGEDFHQYFQEEIPRLSPFIQDGLIEPNLAQGVKVTDLGQIIIRPICMIFDHYLAKAAKEGKPSHTFSKTL